MAVDMSDITLRVGHWLKKNNLPTEGVKIVIEFPERRHAEAATDCIMAEVAPMLITMDVVKFGQMDTMNGIGLAFRQKRF